MHYAYEMEYVIRLNQQESRSELLTLAVRTPDRRDGRNAQERRAIASRQPSIVLSLVQTGKEDFQSFLPANKWSRPGDQVWLGTGVVARQTAGSGRGYCYPRRG